MNDSKHRPHHFKKTSASIIALTTNIDHPLFI